MSPPAPLFRPEVMQASQTQWLGSIRISRPPWFGWVTLIALTLAITLVVFSVWGQVTRKAKLPGVLIPQEGLIQVAAPQTGVVSELLVQEGQQVEVGQVLLRISSQRHLTSGGEASDLNAKALAQRRAALQTEQMLVRQQAQQRQTSLHDRLRSLQKEEQQARGELETIQLRVALAKRSQDRFEELASSGFVSKAQVQAKEEELLDLNLRERNARRSLEALERDKQLARNELQTLDNTTQSAISQLERSLAQLSQEDIEQQARGGLTITATHAGVVTALTVSHPGQNIQSGQTLLALAPQVAGNTHNNAVNLEAQLFAPSRTTGFVTPGQTVWLRYAAYPYQKFGMAQGHVHAVSQSPISAQDLPPGQAQALLMASQSQEPLYRITVKLHNQMVNAYGKPQALKAGMALEADVIQDRRAVWEWVMEPVLAAHKQVRVLNADPVGRREGV